MSTKKAPFKPRADRSSIYDDLWEAMAALRPGQSLQVQAPEGVSSRTLINRINVAMARVEIPCHPGCYFDKRSGLDDSVIISCVRDE